MLKLVLFSSFVTHVALKQPNILLILADDYGFNDIGYHNSEINTPNLDELAFKGVRLENYYVQPICTPTRSQLLSGRYQIHTGLQSGNIMPSIPNALPTDSLTIANKLKDAGYRTHYVGKWHLGFYKREFLPTRRGFDTFYGFYTGSKSYYSHGVCHNKMCGLDYRENDAPATSGGRYSTHLFSTRVVDIIKQKSTKPFFIYLSYQAVHAPLEVPGEYVRPYRHIKDIRRRKYAGMVAAMDEGIGNITKSLEINGLWDNTLIIFSTDNGGQVYSGGNNFPLRGNKGSYFEAGIHGIGFVSGGFVKNKGTESRELIHVSDWFPTLLNLAGGNYNGVQQLDGFDQWKTINGEQNSPRQVILHNIDPVVRPVGQRMFRNTFDSRRTAAIRYKDYKLLTGNPGTRTYNPHPEIGTARKTPDEPSDKNVWLFNIKDDPLETNDISQVRLDVVRMMLDMLFEIDKTSLPVRYPRSDPTADPQLRDGYWGPWKG